MRCKKSCQQFSVSSHENRQRIFGFPNNALMEKESKTSGTVLVQPDASAYRLGTFNDKERIHGNPAYMSITGTKQGLITAGAFTEDSVGNTTRKATRTR